MPGAIRRRMSSRGRSAISRARRPRRRGRRAPPRRDSETLAAQRAAAASSRSRARHRHDGPARGERIADRRADAARAAGHERDLAGEAARARKVRRTLDDRRAAHSGVRLGGPAGSGCGRGGSARNAAAYAAATARTSIDARAGTIEIGSGAEAVGAGRPVGRHRLGPDAADRKDQRLAGSTARHASSAAGGSWSAGNILSPSAPAASAANASVGVATPGTQTRPCRLASRMTATSACGITIRRPPAALTRATSSTSSTVPAPTRQRSPQRSAQRADRIEGPRRVERHLEHAEAGIDEHRGDRRDLLRRDAAQHRDQRQRREVGVRADSSSRWRRGNRSTRPACCAMRQSPRAAASAGPGDGCRCRRRANAAA